MAAYQEDMQELGGQSSSSTTKDSTINDVSIPWTSSTTDDDHRNLAAAAESICRNDDWIISVMAADRDSPQPELKKMQKVPRELRESERNKGFFDPRVVSIGPYHHGKHELEEAEKFKIRAARAVIADSKREPHEFYNMILKVVGDARKCYLEGSTDAYDDEAFAHMMFLDGCFVLHCILALPKFENIFFTELKGHFGIAGYRGIISDIMLLENQLPFLVLQTLIRTRYPEERQGEELIDKFIVRAYIDEVSTWTEIQNYYKNGRADQPLHLLQLLRRRFLGHSHDDMTELEQSSSTFCSKLISCWSKRRQPKDPIKDAYSFSFRSATELKARGIHFRPSTTFCLKDFTFNSRFGYGLLTLPRLRVGRGLKYRLLNMMAYELSPSTDTDQLWVCSYVCFMNSLINGAEDAIELRSQNIIHNFYGTDEEVAKAFNSVAAGIGYLSLEGPIKDVSDQIQTHYNSRLKTWTAQLLHNYFTTPWSAIAFFAATFALVLTFLQTFFPHK